MGLRLVFLGTPEFAVASLEACVAAGHEVAAVYTQPDRPKGRGQALAAPPVKQSALRLGLEVRQPVKVRAPEVVSELGALAVDAMVVVGYGQIIPQVIIDLPRLGIVNVHASLLPRYRGAAPIQWAIARGETRTGVTTMMINAGLDTGDMLLKAEVEIGVEETAVELSRRLAPLGAALLIETLAGAEAGTLPRTPQNDAEATLAPILRKEDGLIDWTWPAATIQARARGFQPWPGVYTAFRGQPLQVWTCRVDAASSPLAPAALAVAGERLLAGCGDGVNLELLELQLPGKKRMAAGAFVNGYRPQAEEKLG